MLAAAPRSRNIEFSTRQHKIGLNVDFPKKRSHEIAFMSPKVMHAFKHCSIVDDNIEGFNGSWRGSEICESIQACNPKHRSAAQRRLAASDLDADTVVATANRIAAVGRETDLDTSSATITIDAKGTALAPG